MREGVWNIGSSMTGSWPKVVGGGKSSRVDLGDCCSILKSEKKSIGDNAWSAGS